MTGTASTLTNWRKPRGRVAALSRSRLPDDPDLIEARQDLKAGRLAAYIADCVASAPPLRPDQLDQLALLLSGDGPDAA